MTNPALAAAGRERFFAPPHRGLRKIIKMSIRDDENDLSGVFYRRV